MKKTKLAASLLAVSMLATTVLAGCDNTDDTGSNNNSTNSNTNNNSDDNNSSNSGSDITSETAWKQTLSYDASTTIRMACGYQKPNEGPTFDAETAGSGVKLADGNTYNAGDFKPTWVEVMKRLNFNLEDKWRGSGSADSEWKVWVEQLDQVDFVAGSASTLTAAGNEGMLLNIADYLDSMPYFKAYLERNPIVRLSITASTTGLGEGAIYFSPYFDGVNDIERMPLMRVDWVEDLLNGSGEFTAEKSGKITPGAYTPYMPTSSTVTVDVVKADGTGTETVTKNYDKAGNIVQKMNDFGEMDGVQAVNMLRKYIDEAYEGYYGDNRADLFIGQNAAWDADELVALLRCIVSNAYTLNGGDKVNGLFSREDSNNQRRVDMFRFAGTLFGVRGLESRQDYLYVGNDNKLHDARSEEDAYKAMEKMNQMAQEGLLSEGFMAGNDDNAKSENYLAEDMGFMHYDYSQTQTAYNTKLQDGEKYTAVLVPVARWNDGTGEKYFRFTESWRSVKTDAWAISLAGVGYSATQKPPKNADELTDKAKAILTLIDYAYSKEGMILMSYGPDEFLKHDDNGNIVYFNFNGEQWPEISQANWDSLQDIGKGNYTNYARRYLGSTLSFAKSQAFEYQCTNEIGKEGANKISVAIGLGVIKHPELGIPSNAWYTSVPTVLPNTSAEASQINNYKDLTSNFSSKSKEINKFVDIIVNGFGETGFESVSAAAKHVAEDLGGNAVCDLKNNAWERLYNYYNENFKN